VSLVVEGKTVQAHKVLLAAASDYFAAMFTGNMIESEMETVELQGLEFSALQLLVDYCYTGERVKDSYLLLGVKHQVHLLNVLKTTLY